MIIELKQLISYWYFMTIFIDPCASRDDKHITHWLMHADCNRIKTIIFLWNLTGFNDKNNYEILFGVVNSCVGLWPFLMSKNAKNKKNKIGSKSVFIHLCRNSASIYLVLMILFSFFIVLCNVSILNLNNLSIHLFIRIFLAHTIASFFLVCWIVRFLPIERRMCSFVISRTGSTANEIKAFNAVLRVLNPSADRVSTRLTLLIVRLMCFVKAIIDLSFCFKRVEKEEQNTTSRNYV